MAQLYTRQDLSASTVFVDPATDLERWRLRDENGRHTWHYLKSDEEVKNWPQTVYDRHFLGLPIDLPTYPKPTRPSEAARNATRHFANFQMPSGHWACEYGGPMFLLPGLVITWYVTETPIPDHIATEIKRYLFARQNPEDGGWGLHIEGHSSVFGTALNYVVCRLLGAGEEDPRLIKARGKLHELGGALCAPHWGKFWLSVLGVMEWDAVNPVPPDLWLLPDWIPFHPWRWWIHMRQVYLPMGFVWSTKWTFKETPLTRQLRDELYTQAWGSINFSANRNTIASSDNYHPKTLILKSLNWLLVNVYNPYLRVETLRQKSEDWAFKLIQMEDENTLFSNLGPVNAPMNFLACYIREGPDAESVQKHRDRMHDFLWMKDEGMLMNGTNGVQVWDTVFLIQAVVEAGLAEDEEFRPMLTKALEFLEDQQIKEECHDRAICYRHYRKGAWPFSNKIQGYTVSDCTAEGVKSTLMLQSLPGYPQLISKERLRDAVDVMLSMQNQHDGGFASYELQRGSEYMELLNAAEVFGRIMVEYEYPECTTAVVTGLSMFRKYDPDYRAAEIDACLTRAVDWIRGNQRPDGSWYGSWGICFTYASFFACESLASMGEQCTNSERQRRVCEFLISKQRSDGGWGESYKSCELSEWVEHKDTQVVQTCWALLAMMHAGYQERDVLEKGIKLIMSRQQPDGGWKQEAIEGVFNKSCMISYPNYKYYWPIKTLGMFARIWGDSKLF